jgi:hypothetical protein
LMPDIRNVTESSLSGRAVKDQLPVVPHALLAAPVQVAGLFTPRAEELRINIAGVVEPIDGKDRE